MMAGVEARDSPIGLEVKMASIQAIFSAEADSAAVEVLLALADQEEEVDTVAAAPAIRNMLAAAEEALIAIKRYQGVVT